AGGNSSFNSMMRASAPMTENLSFSRSAFDHVFQPDTDQTLTAGNGQINRGTVRARWSAPSSLAVMWRMQRESPRAPMRLATSHISPPSPPADWSIASTPSTRNLAQLRRRGYDGRFADLTQMPVFRESEALHEPEGTTIQRGPDPDALLDRSGRQPDTGRSHAPPGRRGWCSRRVLARAFPHAILLPGRGPR